jgi:acyl dehydratase
MIAELQFEDIAEGQESSLGVELTTTVVDRFADLSGDVCPLHTNEEFAKDRGFEGRVVHGALLGALVSRLVGTRLPGKNAIVHRMELAFHHPTHVGDAVRVTGRVTRKFDALRAILLAVEIHRTGPGGDRCVASGKVQIGFTARPTPTEGVAVLRSSSAPVPAGIAIEEP